MQQFMKSQSRLQLTFALVIVGLHVVFYLLALHYQHIYNGDSFEYIQEAVNIKDNFFFYSGNRALPILEEYKTLRTPLYPVFLALIYSLKINNWLVLFVQNALSVFNVFYFRKILLENGYTGRFHWLLLLFIVGFPVQFIYANTIAPEILLQTFSLFYFRYAFRFLTSRQAKAAFQMSTALLLALLTKPVFYPFAFLHFLLVCGFIIFYKTNWRRCLAAAFIPIAGIVLYSFWNYERTGKYHFSSIQSFNAIFYYNSYLQAKNGFDSSRSFLNHERQIIAGMPAFKDRYDYAHQRGSGLLKENFSGYTLFHVKHSLLFYLEPGKGEIDLFTGRMTLGGLYTAKTANFREVLNTRSFQKIVRYLTAYPATWLALFILALNLVKCTGVLLFFFYARVNRVAKWFLLICFGYFALITGPISSPHYVLPVSLIFAGCAVRGFEWITNRKTSTPQPLVSL